MVKGNMERGGVEKEIVSRCVILYIFEARVNLRHWWRRFTGLIS